MTNKSKVAELLEGVEADAERVDFKYAGRDIDSHFFVSVGEACKHVDESLIKKISLLYPTATIERAFGPVLAELQTSVNSWKLNCEMACIQVASLNEHINAQAALLVQQEREILELRKELKNRPVITRIIDPRNIIDD